MAVGSLRTGLPMLVLSLVLMGAGCGDDDSTEADLGGVDTGGEADMGGDSDASPDASPDASSDASSEVDSSLPEENCTNEVDDDGDEDIDCDDSDCEDEEVCEEPPEEDCDTPGDEDGNELADCDDPVCEETAACLCGDGELDEPGEECDDGDDNSDDEPNACRTDCTLPVCGDEVIDDEYDEECEGGSDCDDECHLLCGNGEIDEPEECDDGDDNSDEDSDACRTTCLEADCGDGVTDIDLEEECDDGEGNSDRVPNACRIGCISPWCGDGLTDLGEQCDNGEDENGPDAICSDLCKLNVDLACAGIPDVMDLDEVGENVGGVIRYLGSLEAATSDHVPTAECVAEGVETGEDVIFIFRPNADGDYLITTNVPTTMTDTVVYHRAHCDREGGLECNDDDGMEPGSTIIIEEMLAGAPYFIVVDSIADTAGIFGLEIRPIAGVVDEDEDCTGEGVVCRIGLVCTPLGETSECRSQEAPSLEEILFEWVSNDAVLHRFRGSDRNRDVEAPDFISILLGDASSLGPFNFAFTDVQWIDDQYEGVVTITGFSELGVVALTAAVHDSMGLQSEILTLDYPEYVAPLVVGEGEECDMNRRANTCLEPFICERDDEGVDTCGEAQTPVLTGFTAERIAADAVRFRFIGSDANGDVATWDASFLDGDGVESFSGSFNLPPTGIGMVDFNLTSELVGTGLAVDSGIATVLATITDQTSLVSEQLETAFPLPEVVGAGEDCDLSSVTTTCDEGLTCLVDGFGGAVCRGVVEPGAECDDVDLFCPAGYACLEDDEGQGHCEADPMFPCGFDMLVLNVPEDAAETDDGYLLTFDTSDAPDNSVPATAECAFQGQAAGGEAVAVYTAAGAELVTVTTVLAGMAIDTIIYARLGGCFAMDAEIACNDDDPSGATYQSTVEFTLEAGETVFVFIDAWDVGGPGQALFTVLPIISEDGDCDVYETDNTCAEMLYCSPDSETCVIPPADYCGTLTKIDVNEDGDVVDGGIQISFDTTGLTNLSDPTGCSYAGGGEAVAFYTAPDKQEVTVTTDLEGTDIDTVVYARDLCSDPSTEIICNDDNGAGWQSTIVFTLEMGETAYVFLDAFSDGGAGLALFSFYTFLAEGEDCSPEVLDAECDDGLYCEPSGQLCQLPEYCGAIPIIDVVATGTPVGSGILIDYDTSTETNLSAPFTDGCTDDGTATGGEVIAVYTAEVDEEMTVTTDLDGVELDTVIYVRSEICLSPLFEIACNDDDGVSSQSTVTAMLSAGETIYLFLDDRGTGGVGQALFSFRQLLEEGDTCDTDEVDNFCDEGLYCEPISGSCRPPGYCAEIPVIDVVDVGTATEDGILVDFDTTGFDNLSNPFTADCTDDGTAPGGEVVAVYTAEMDLELTVTTDIEGVELDTILYARLDSCLGPDSEVDCADDDEAVEQTTLVITLLENETLYLFLDAATGGVGQALFTEVAILAEGDACEPGEVDGYCDGDLYCEESSGSCRYPEYCGEIPVINVVEEGTAVAEGVLIDFDTTDWESLSDPFTEGCAVDDTAPGGEVIAVYAADVDEVVTVTTILEGVELDTVLYGRLDVCLGAGDEVACNDNDAGGDQSNISFELLSGETIYVFIDTITGGVGQALFSMEPL